MKRKYLKIDGSKGYVMRNSGTTEMQNFWGMFVTSEEVRELSPTNVNPQFLMVMLTKNCVLHIITEKLESVESYQPFIGTVLLVFSEDGKDKITVLVVERDESGFIDSFYLKVQYRNEEKMIALARGMTELWIKGTENRLIDQVKGSFLEMKE